MLNLLAADRHVDVDAQVAEFLARTQRLAINVAADVQDVRARLQSDADTRRRQQLERDVTQVCDVIQRAEVLVSEQVIGEVADDEADRFALDDVVDLLDVARAHISDQS